MTCSDGMDSSRICGVIVPGRNGLGEGLRCAPRFRSTAFKDLEVVVLRHDLRSCADRFGGWGDGRFGDVDGPFSKVDANARRAPDWIASPDRSDQLSGAGAERKSTGTTTR